LLGRDADDDVAELDAAVAAVAGAAEARLRGAAVRHHGADEHALDAEIARGLVAEDGDAHARALDAAGRDDLRHDAADEVDRHGEADPGAGAALGVDHRVHADEAAAGVDERAA